MEPSILQRAIDKYGNDDQLNMAKEELAELIVAISHYQRGRLSKESAEIIAEIVDVYIMLEQIKMILGIQTQVDNYIIIKLAKLKQRLDDDIQTTL